MHRSYPIRLQPNAAQRAKLGLYLERLRELYNMALQQRQDAWRIAGKSPKLFDQQRDLTELREHPDYAVIPASICRDALRRLQRAFDAFFRRVEAKQKPGFPRFKGQGRYESFAIDSQCFKVGRGGIRIPGLGVVKFKTSREVQGTPKQLVIFRRGKKWLASITSDIGPAPAKRVVERAVGIDVGLTTLATLSDGTEIENPRWMKQCEEQIIKAHRALTRKHLGSANWLKAKEALRRAHQRAANCRTNYLHHVSKWLVANYDLIAYEKLDTLPLSKSYLSKSISDAGWGQLLYQVGYKAEEAGAYCVAVNPRGTSQMCSGCGATVNKPLKEREHRCGCGLVLGRDLNAALNILKLGETALGRSAVAQAARASEDALPAAIKALSMVVIH